MKKDWRASLPMKRTEPKKEWVMSTAGLAAGLQKALVELGYSVTIQGKVIKGEPKYIVLAK